MSPNPNVETVRQLIAAWNSHDLDRIARFFHDDFENHQAPLPPVIGLDAYLRHCEHWFTAFPDFTIEEVTLFGQDDLVCLESRGGGTRASDFFGYEASGGEEIVDACDVFWLRDGKIALERGYWDFSVATARLAPRARER
jgi:steroid delta-isomerase-like uncharacterized protein